MRGYYAVVRKVISDLLVLNICLMLTTVLAPISNADTIRLLRDSLELCDCATFQPVDARSGVTRASSVAWKDLFAFLDAGLHVWHGM